MRGDEGTGSRVQEVLCGVGRTLEDMQPRRFGTVRPKPVVDLTAKMTARWADCDG
jgi:hypothetical protein